MYITAVPNRGSPPAILLRESYREGGKVKNRTLANLTKWPPHVVEAMRVALKGGRVVPADDIEIIASRDHGAAALVLGIMNDLGLPKLIAPRASRQRSLVLGMIAARILRPSTKLALTRWWTTTTLPELLGVEDGNEDGLYEAMDWVAAQQASIEQRLASRHLRGGSLVLYDISSSYVTGRHCPLAAHGYSRDHRGDRPQIVFGVLTDAEGCPVAVEVFTGNTADSSTVLAQIEKVKVRFGLSHLVFVGDRGMVKRTQVEALRTMGGVDWVSAITSKQLQGIRDQGAIQLELFDQRNLVEVESPDFPGERLVICRNPALAAERSRKREALLQATEEGLRGLQASVQAGRLKDADKIALRAGRLVSRKKMAKHFILDIGPGHFAFHRDEERIRHESELDGFYAIRSSLSHEQEPEAADLVRIYKRLAQVERVFRSMKTVDLLVRPIHHRTETRVRAHIFLCMLSAHVIWHMNRRLEAYLFADPELRALHATEDPVAPVRRSEEGQRKVTELTSQDDHPLHSLKTLLKEMATLTRVSMRIRGQQHPPWTQDATPSAYQRAVFAAAGVAV
jgi:transposase